MGPERPLDATPDSMLGNAVSARHEQRSRSAVSMTDLVRQRTVADPPAPTAARVDFPRAGRATARGRWWRDALRRRLLATADLTAAALATLVATVPATGSFWAMAFLPLWPVVAKLLGLYDRDHRALRHLTADEVPGILAYVAIMVALIALLLPLTPAGGLDGVAIGAYLLAAAVATTGLRAVTPGRRR
jgi:hypothetical protein